MTNNKLLIANFSTIDHFKRSTFDEMLAIVISTLFGVLLNFDVSRAKFVFSDEEWNNQPENTLVGPQPEFDLVKIPHSQE